MKKFRSHGQSAFLSDGAVVVAADILFALLCLYVDMIVTKIFLFSLSFPIFDPDARTHHTIAIELGMRCGVHQTFDMCVHRRSGAFDNPKLVVASETPDSTALGIFHRRDGLAVGLVVQTEQSVLK